MHSRSRLASIVILCSAVVLVFNVGCPLGGLPDLRTPIALDEAMDSESFVGGNDERLVFMSTDYEGLPTVTPWDLLTGGIDLTSIEDSFDVRPTIRVSTVDPDSLGVTLLTGIDGGDEWGSMSDGRWLAWTNMMDVDDDAVHVLDLESGTKTEYFGGRGNGFWMRALENGRLILDSSVGSDVYVIVLDLSSGEASLLPTDVADFDQVIVHGDWLAMSYEPSPDVPPASVDDLLDHSVSPSANIDLINLSTGQSRTITGVDSYPYLFLTDTQVFWTHLEDQTTTVRAQDLAGGQTQDILTFADTDDETVYMNDVCTSGIILNRSLGSYDLFGYYHELYELHTPDGRTITVLDYAPAQSWDNLMSPIWPSMRCVGTVIVYQDPDSGAWVVFDPTTETRRPVQPFAQ